MDGNNPVELFLFLHKLTADMRKNPRTVLVECDTLRMRGHGEHDDSSYVPRELLAEYGARDPIKVTRERLTSEGILTVDEIAAIEQACLAEVDIAYQQALKDPPPDPATMANGVYADA